MSFKWNLYVLLIGFLSLCVMYSCEPDLIIKLNKDDITLNDGETETLTAIVSPSSATDRRVVWSSSNTSIATVDNGVVKAVALGNAVITARCGDVSASCKVTVKPTPVSGIKLDKDKISVMVGQTETLIATVLPKNATNKQLVWSSSNTSIVTVDNGVVTAIAPGSAVVTVACDDVSAVCDVLVTPEPETGKYQYVFGYAYSKDLLKFLIPTISVTIDGQETQVYRIEDGNNTSANEGVSYADISIHVTPAWAMVWWLGKRFETEQKGTVTITYERKDIDYSIYDETNLSLTLNLLSRPFVDQSSGGLSVNNHLWVSITIGQHKTLKETIDEIVSSSDNMVSF